MGACQPIVTKQRTCRTHASPSDYQQYIPSLNGMPILCGLVNLGVPTYQCCSLTRHIPKSFIKLNYFLNILHDFLINERKFLNWNSSWKTTIRIYHLWSLLNISFFEVFSQAIKFREKLESKKKKKNRSFLQSLRSGTSSSPKTKTNGHRSRRVVFGFELKAFIRLQFNRNEVIRNQSNVIRRPKGNQLVECS